MWIYSIIGSLAGTSYFGPVAGHGIETHDLNLLRSQRKKHVVEGSGTVGGEIEAKPNEAGDSYVALTKKEKPEEKEGESKNDGGEDKGKGEEKKDEKKE